MTTQSKKIENKCDEEINQNLKHKGSVSGASEASRRLRKCFIANRGLISMAMTLVIMLSTGMVGMSCFGNQDDQHPKSEQALDDSASLQTAAGEQLKPVVARDEDGGEQDISIIHLLTAKSLIEFETNRQSSLRLAIEAYTRLEQTEDMVDQSVLASWLIRLSQQIGGIPLQHSKPISTFAIAPNGKCILTGSSGKLYFWKVNENPTSISKPKLLHDFGISKRNARPVRIREIQFNPTNYEQVMVVLANPNLLNSQLFRVSESGDSTVIATWTINDRMDGWSYRNFSPDGKWALFTSPMGNNEIALFDLTQDDPLEHKRIYRVGNLFNKRQPLFSPDSKWLCTYDNDGPLILDLGQNGTDGSIRLGNEYRDYAAIDHDSRLLAVTSHQVVSHRIAVATVFDLNAFDPAKPIRIETEGDKIDQFLFFPDGGGFAVCLSNRIMIGRSSRKDQRMQDLEQLPGSASVGRRIGQQVAISNDGTWLISFQEPNGGFSEATLWRLGFETGDAEIVFKGAASSFAFSRSGKFVAIGQPNHQILTWFSGVNKNFQKQSSLVAHSAGPTTIFGGTNSAIKKLQFSEDERFLVSQGEDNCLRLWPCHESNGVVNSLNPMATFFSGNGSNFVLDDNQKWLVSGGTLFEVGTESESYKFISRSKEAGANIGDKAIFSKNANWLAGYRGGRAGWSRRPKRDRGAKYAIDLWDLRPTQIQEPIAVFTSNHPFKYFDFDPNQKSIAAVDGQGAIYQRSIPLDQSETRLDCKLKVKGNQILTCDPLPGTDDWVTSSFDSVARKPGEMPIYYPAEKRVSFVELHRVENQKDQPVELGLATGPIAFSKQLKKIAFKNKDEGITITTIDSSSPSSTSSQSISAAFIQKLLKIPTPAPQNETVGFEIFGNFLIVRMYSGPPGTISSLMAKSTTNSRALVFKLGDLDEPVVSTIELKGSIHRVINGPGEHQVTVTEFGGDLYIYDIRTGVELAKPTQHIKSKGHAIVGVTYSSDRSWLALRFSNRSVDVFTRTTRSALFESRGTINNVETFGPMGFIPNSSNLMINGRVYALDPSKIVKYFKSVVEKDASQAELHQGRKE
ncbi:WD40 repeat domain-containing protein [Mariniblastus sp.]|nr:WD40 repeat domain-containing protein [Mariniblastus sp.]